MADQTVTAANVKTSRQPRRVKFGAEIGRGQLLYKDTADNEYKKMQADQSALIAGSADAGIAVCDSGDDQYGLIISEDPAFEPGFTAVEGEVYAASVNDGLICLHSDLVSTNNVTIVGVGNSDGTLDLNIDATGAVVP